MRTSTAILASLLAGSLLSGSLLAACNNLDGTSCENLMSRLKDCAVITGGNVYCDDSEPTEEDRCYSACTADASCEELKDLVCYGIPSMEIEDCGQACYAKYAFVCADGLATYPSDWVCDGIESCDDGSDEEGCETFECTDGSAVIVMAWVCDGMETCSDGSDEEDCNFTFFQCEDGSGEVLTSEVCDFFPDCADESDEAGCAKHICN